MSYKYKILPHPADIKLEITASCKEDIFKGALEGMAYIIQPNISKNSGLVEEEIEIHSMDINALLVDFLNEVLAKSDIYNSVFNNIKIEKLKLAPLQLHQMLPVSEQIIILWQELCTNTVDYVLSILQLRHLMWI
mgnify:CR=1 FL=1